MPANRVVLNVPGGLMPPSARSQPKIANRSAILAGAALMHPDLGSLSNNVPVTNMLLAAKSAQSEAAGNGPISYSVSDLLDIEHELWLNPMEAFKRHFRVYLLPVAVDASGNLSAAPQRDCVPYRLHVPSGSATGATISGLECGVDQYYASGDAVPAPFYGEGAPTDSPGAILRPIVATVGKKIAATSTLASGTVCGMWCWDLSDEGLLLPPLGREVIIGAKQTITHGAAAVTIKPAPQKSMRIRRLAFNDTVTNWNKQVDATHGIQVQQLLVGNEPQTESSGALPGTMFGMGNFAANIDGDLCKVGKVFGIQVVNNEAANDISLETYIWGDSLDD